MSLEMFIFLFISLFRLFFQPSSVPHSPAAAVAWVPVAPFTLLCVCVCVHVFGLWGKDREPRENPPREKEQTETHTKV